LDARQGLQIIQIATAGLACSQLTVPGSAGTCSLCPTALVSHGQSCNTTHAADSCWFATAAASGWLARYTESL